MRMSNNGDMSGVQGATGQQQQGVQSGGPEQALRMHQAEALLRSQAEAALRLAVNFSVANNVLLIGISYYLLQHFNTEWCDESLDC